MTDSGVILIVVTHMYVIEVILKVITGDKETGTGVTLNVVLGNDMTDTRIIFKIVTSVNVSSTCI